jgi:hypothetical protein
MNMLKAAAIALIGITRVEDNWIFRTLGRENVLLFVWVFGVGLAMLIVGSIFMSRNPNSQLQDTWQRRKK